MGNDDNEPSGNHVEVAYSVAADLHNAVQAVIWQRNSSFLIFNTVVTAAFVALRQPITLPSASGGQGMTLTVRPEILGYVAIVAFAYCLLWGVSMARSWAYHDAYFAVMKEYEERLGLGYLGPAGYAMKYLA